VREKKPRRFALQDGGEGLIPDLQIDVRRRSRRHSVGNSLDAHAGRIANKRDAFCLVEITDVMRCMARCIDDFELARAERKCFAAFEDAQILRWNGKSFSEQLL